jgi:hypothetical protein
MRKRLGDVLKAARGRTPLAEISERLKDGDLPLSDSTLSRIENGSIGTPVDRYRILCRAYRVQYSDLIDALLTGFEGNAKEKFIAEIETLSTDEQVLAAMERVKSFPREDREDLMEGIKRAAIQIQLAKLDEVKKKYGLGE